MSESTFGFVVARKKTFLNVYNAMKVKTCCDHLTFSITRESSLCSLYLHVSLCERERFKMMLEQNLTAVFEVNAGLDRFTAWIGHDNENIQK